MTAAPTGTSQPTVVSTTRRQRIVVVAADAAQLNRVANKLRGMALFGHRVVLVWQHGEPSKRLSSLKARVHVQRPSARGLRERARHVATISPKVWLRDRGTLAGALWQDPRAVRALARADAVLPVGPEALELADQLAGPQRPLVPAQELREWERVGEVWRELRERVDAGPGELSPAYARRLLRHIDLLGGSVQDAYQPMLVPLVESLHGAGRYDLARAVAAHLREEGARADAVDRALRRGLKVLTRTSDEGAAPAELRPAAADLVAAADSALAAQDLTRAVSATTLALQLLFHRELHADTLASPLVEEPDAFLADWRASRVGQLLAAPTPRRPALRRGRTAYRDRPRVVVVPGTYPQFATPVVEALQERAEVQVVDLAARPELRGLGTRRELVEARLRQALGEEEVPDYELLEEMEAGDALFVDWADRGGLAAVMAAPEGLPVTLRIHSMDALSPWIHLVDWSRVRHLVLVSEHLRDLVVRLLGDRLAGTEVHVIPNVLDPSRIPTHKTEGHHRRLLMVGWAQRVKDPLWALEILAALRSQDPAWRLSLVGADFRPGAVRSQEVYVKEFWRRLAQDDVRGAVDFTGFTRDLAPHLAAAGFVLSTSRRESFGLGLVESAASGAVPVVRDWPIFASLDGARRLFPDEWVVGSVDEAVERIRAHAQEPAWSQASEEARAVVAERFGVDTARTAFQRLVLG